MEVFLRFPCHVDSNEVLLLIILGSVPVAWLGIAGGGAYWSAVISARSGKAAPRTNREISTSDEVSFVPCTWVTYVSTMHSSSLSLGSLRGVFRVFLQNGNGSKSTTNV